MEEFQPVGEWLRPTPATPGKVRTDPALHMGRDLQLGKDDPQSDPGDDGSNDQGLQGENHPEVVKEAGEDHRSTSPSTKSRLPRIAMMSGTSIPLRSHDSTERLEKDADRIFSR